MITDLISTPEGSISHTKLWSNIAYLATTIIIINQAIACTLTAEFLLIYLGIVGGHTTASKFLALKYNKENK